MKSFKFLLGSAVIVGLFSSSLISNAANESQGVSVKNTKNTESEAALQPASVVKAKPEDNLVGMLAKMKSLTAQFEQEILDHEAQSLQKTKGRLSLARPGKMYWHAEPPYEQVIVGDGKTLWVYDPDLEQVEIRSAEEQMQTPMRLLTSSASDIIKQYSVKETYTAKDNTLKFELTPLAKGEQNAFETLEFTFRAQQLIKISMIDRLRQKTQITLSEHVLNPNLDEALFQFEIPDGVDVIEE